MTVATGSNEVPASTRQAIRDGIDDAVARTKDGLDQAQAKVSDAYATSREKASAAYATAREKAQTATKSASDGFDTHPLAAVLGGLAIGAVIGAFLPRTQQEAKVLGAAGQKLRGAAGDAIEAAKEAGRDKLDELGLSREHARETMKSLLDGAISAAGSAGSAALDTAKKKTGA